MGEKKILEAEWSRFKKKIIDGKVKEPAYFRRSARLKQLRSGR
jgi:hypothetical protein